METRVTSLMSETSGMSGADTADGGEATTPPAPEGTRVTFRGGVRAMMAFWPGAGLFGVVYAVAARAAGLSGAETLGMSALVHAGRHNLRQRG